MSLQNAKVGSVAAKEEDSAHRLYYQFDQPMSRLQATPNPRSTAAQKEGFLKVNLDLDLELALGNRQARGREGKHPGGQGAESSPRRRMHMTAWIFPSVERETRNALDRSWPMKARSILSHSTSNPFLMQPPVKGHVTTGLDPGYRNGCKVAVVSDTGKVLDTTVVYPTFGDRQKEEAIENLNPS